MNLDTWKGLSPEDQKIFREAGIAAEDNYLAEMSGVIDAMYKKWEEQGVKIFTMSDSEIQKWVEAMPDLKENWAEEMEDKGMPGQEIVDLYIELGGMGK